MHGKTNPPPTPFADVEGVTINLPTLEAATAEVMRRAERGESFTVFTLNLDHLVKLKSSAHFVAAYQRANLVTADGWPIVWLAERQGSRLERASGADMVEPLCEAAAARGVGVYFVGPGPDAQAGALRILRDRFKELKIVGAETPRLPAGDGPAFLTAFDIDALATRINASGARLCFVSLGAPKQELAADALAARCPHTGFLCVGAALDFISGEVRRAPRWMQRGKLEWFWRLASDPRRLGARYARCALLFFGAAIRATMLRRPSPVGTAPR